MGAHPSGPSRIKNSQELLSEWIKNHKDVLGEDIFNRYGQLPFLFKILSIEKGLGNICS